MGPQQATHVRAHIERTVTFRSLVRLSNCVMDCNRALNLQEQSTN
jgi:hypothetical protein